MDNDILLNRIMHLLLHLQYNTRIYMGICVNTTCGAPRHPHWDDNFWTPYNLQEAPITTNFPPHYTDVRTKPMG